MEVGLIKNKIVKMLVKYKYSILVLLIGFVLMLLPSVSIPKKNDVRADTVHEINAPSLEQQLTDILSHISGAGMVEVVLTMSQGEEVVYQTNQDRNVNASGEQSKNNTVTITDSERNQQGLIRQVIPPRYQGAIILCQGADDPAVRLDIVDAVSKATGLGANKISVLKMK
jgi:stage III sporulation protein AG